MNIIKTRENCLYYKYVPEKCQWIFFENCKRKVLCRFLFVEVPSYLHLLNNQIIKIFESYKDSNEIKLPDLRDYLYKSQSKGYYIFPNIRRDCEK
jgi:hypothetical protein